MPVQRAAEAKDQQRAQADQRDEQLSKVRQDVAAAPPPRPDTSSVTVFRGREVAERRLQADSARPAPSAKAADAVAATGTIRGRVADGNNTGLESVMVTLVGTSIGVTTNASGQFELRGVPAGTQRVAARRVGFQPSTREITVTPGQAAIADFRLSAAVASLENVVVTGAASAPRRATAGSTVAPPAAAPPVAAKVAAPPAQSATAAGCYQLSITPASAPMRTGFREVPRSIALDSTVVPSRTDGVWYQVRSLAGTATAGTGVWRPTSPDAVEVQWTYGSRTATLSLGGVPGPVLRGTGQEIDRATAVGEAGIVIAAKVKCSS